MTLSTLERLGLEVVAFTMLGSRMQSALLLALLDANGRTVGWETLGQARKWRMTGDTEATKNAIKVRISLLRESLDDIGFPDAIVTSPHDKHHPSLGYSIPAGKRTAILDRLIEEANE